MPAAYGQGIGLVSDPFGAASQVGSVNTTTAETVVSRDLPLVNAVATATGVAHFRFFTAMKTGTVTSITMATGTTAAAATPTLCKMGFFSVAADDSLTLLSATANDTALFAAANTVYSKALAVPQAKTAGQRYAVGVLIVTAGQAPTFTGVIASVISAMDAEYAIVPRVCASASGQADLASVAVGSLTNTRAYPYARLS